MMERDESFADRPDPRSWKPESRPIETVDEFDSLDGFRPRRSLANEDQNHLRLLSIFHYVVGGIVALIATVPVMHIIMGVMMITGKISTSPKSGPPPPIAFGWMFVSMGSVFVVFGWALAICMFVAGSQCSVARHG